jgi:hypothetical protein
MSSFEYRFVSVVLVFIGNDPKFEVGYPVYACFTRPDEVHRAINAALN